MATRTRSWLPPSLGAGLLWLVLSSCSAPPEPGQSQTKVDDCLRNVNLDRLPALLKHCDAVVEAFREHPQPRNERALLLKLAGKPGGLPRQPQSRGPGERRQTPRRRPDARRDRFAAAQLHPAHH